MTNEEKNKAASKRLDNLPFVGECGDPTVVSTIFISVVFECGNKNKVSKPM
jgi:hypothetical protein